MTEAEKNERIKAVEEQMEKLKKELEDIRNTKVQEWDFRAWDGYPTMLLREYVCRTPIEPLGFAEQFANKLTHLTKLLRFKYCYDRDYVPDWSNRSEIKWYVFRCMQTGTYAIDFVKTWNELSTVYFSSEEIAQKCVNWLNAGCPEE